jgi:hypothetical protein
VLQRLLDLFEANPKSLDQEQICADLGISPASLQSMLDILVRKGRLISPGLDGCAGLCQGCPVQSRCAAPSVPQDQIYRLPPKK